MFGLENNKGKVPNIYTLVAIARALELPDETFIEQLWKDINKENEENYANEQKLKKALIKYGVSNNKLDKVVDFINYNICPKTLEDIIKEFNNSLEFKNKVLKLVENIDRKY